MTKPPPERDMPRRFEELHCEVEMLKHENTKLREKLSAKEDADDQINTVNVRWFDGYHEQFETTEVRFGSDLLWMRLSNGENRHIPLRQVRAFSLSEESHFLTEVAHP